MKSTSLVVALGLSLISLPVFAWDKPGHSVVAAIAFHDLEVNHPEIIAKAAAILKKSADYKSKLDWKQSIRDSTLPPSPQRDNLMLFMLAARWPDDIKADGSGRDKVPVDTHPWHYVNLPFSPDNIPVVPAGTPNIFTAMVAQRAAWNGESRPKKAMAICWFAHLIGDSHQPLHSTELFSARFPKGDEGGVLWHIQKIQTAVALHAFWDDVVITGNDAAQIAADVDQAAVRLAHSHPRSSFPQIAKHRNIESWTKEETFPLAVHVAYMDGNLPLPIPEHPTILSDVYQQNARKVSESQMTLAGYRLADYLTDLLK